MMFRPIVWGIISLLAFGALWFVSVILSVITGGAFRDLANFSGIAAALSLPIALILEVIRWQMKRGKK